MPLLTFMLTRARVCPRPSSHLPLPALTPALTLTPVPTVAIAVTVTRIFRANKCLVDEVTTLRRHLEANHSVCGHVYGFMPCFNILFVRESIGTGPKALIFSQSYPET